MDADEASFGSTDAFESCFGQVNNAPFADKPFVRATVIDADDEELLACEDIELKIDITDW